MLIKKVTLKNIRSYETAEIEFPPGSTVLAGDIGSGKTSILLAIEFVLFGLQPGQKGSSLLRNGAEEGSVSLEMDIDGDNIIIERGLKRGKTVNQSSASIELEGVKQEISVTELKNKVLDLLNYPKEFAKKTNMLYRFTVYTPQDEMRQIILETPEIRLNTLRHIFGIDKYKRIRENADLVTGKLREGMRNLEGQIKDLEDTKKKLDEKKANIAVLEASLLILQDEFKKRKEDRTNAEKGQKEIEEKIKEKEKYEKETEKTEIMLMGKKDVIINIEKEKKDLQKQITEINEQLSKSSDIKELEKKLAVLAEEIKQEKIKQNYIENEIKDLENKIKEKQRYEQEIEKTQFMLQNKKEFISGIDKEKTIISSQIAEINAEIKKINFSPEQLSKLDDGLRANEKLYEDKNKLYLELSGKISSLNSKISEMSALKLDIQKLKLCPTCFQDVTDDYKKNILRKFDDDIQRYKKEISASDSEKEKLSKDRDCLMQDINSARKNIEELKFLKIKLENSKEKELKITDFDKQKISAEKDIALLETQTGTLKESVSFLKKYDLIFEHRKKELQDLVSNERQKNIEIINLQREHDKQVDQKEKIKDKNSRCSELEKQKISAEKDVLLLTTQINTMKESASMLKKYESVYETKQKELLELLRKEREKEIELERTRKEIELTIKLIGEIEKEIASKEQTKIKLGAMTELEDWISTSFLNMMTFTERNIMLKLREEFSKLFNEWFNILVPEIFNVKLDEDFTPIIEQQDYQLDYSFLSGGERTAIALAYRLALNQVLNSLLSKIKTRDLVILDEPTDGFSEQQLDKMRDVLQELNVAQLIIVSHEPKIESFVENIIKFRKEDGVTRIEK